METLSPDHPPSNLVPNRACGECTYCCQYLPVDTEELQKTAGVLCAHCDGKGCAIYETRPPVCRSHFCGWRLSHLFDDTWRPDRIGMLMTVVNTNIPQRYMQEGLQLLLVHPHIALARIDFYQFIFKAVANRVPIFLHMRGPDGCNSAGKLLNPILEDAVEKQDEQAFLALIRKTLKEIENGPFKPVVLKHSPK